MVVTDMQPNQAGFRSQCHRGSANFLDGKLELRS